MYSRSFFWTLFATLLLAGLAGDAARASTFDEQTGRLSLDDADYAVSFDSAEALPEELGVVVFDSEEVQLSVGQVADLFEADEGGLEGTGALVMGGSVRSLTLHLESLATRFGGRRVEIRIWQRPEGTRLKIGISWIVIADPEVAQSVMLGHYRFQQTGNVTDDGWEEWTSGPVDFMAGGAVAPAYLQLEDIQPKGGWIYTTHRTDLRVRVDALEILDLGPAEVVDATCNALSQDDVCGPLGVCMMGRCMDSALSYGPIPWHAEIKDDYLDRRLFEFRSFEGGRMPQSLMNVLAGAVENARGQVSPRRFWESLRRGVRSLRDGHASIAANGYNIRWERTNLGVCVHLGEADLLPETQVIPIVFSVNASNPVADRLQVGDALVAVDGLTVAQWQSALNLMHSGDPEAFDVAFAPYLIPTAWLNGSTLTFARCDRSGPDPAPCGEAELEHIEIDFAQVIGQGVWSGDVPGWMRDNQGCDYRFGRAIDDPGVSDGSFAGYADEGLVRTLIINGLPNPWGSGEDWINTVTEALDPPPDYLILDQRLGNGGSVITTDYIMGLLLTEDDFDRAEIVPVFERVLDDELWGELDACTANAYQSNCGSYMPWVLHDYSGMDSALRGVAGTTRMAVLNGRDVSGNDFTTKLSTFRAAATRIFAPGPTYGAFGPIMSLPAHFNEIMGGSLQLWDSIFIEHPGDPREGFATGVGVSPDEPVLQRQSDALQGIDTTIEAAKAWLLQE